MTREPFIADLHIHSKFSRATARNLDLENIYIWAQLKGIKVVGTGDFTHPEWFSNIVQKLEAAEPGLYRLKKEIAQLCDERVPLSCRAPVRFLLSSEISNIYKKHGRTRKNHNLVFFPEIEDVRRFNTRLDAIGNINSDGRPILGLDARDLLEIVLENSEDGFLVPAHIWTPWFSMLGSKSGFDSIEECFDDLSSYIFAAETGLSSDPAMNWRVKGLDNITLISNSDAHSPAKLGREANLFQTEISYYEMRSAMESGDKNKFKGTFEFFPEEGKYHVDGHRKCEVCLSPAETKAHFGNCPVCKKPLTMGVLHRVEDLATRSEKIRPERAFPFYRLIPLDDLLSEILRVGPQSKKVKQTYHSLLTNLGNEFEILHYLQVDKIESAGVPLLGESINRMRNNRISFNPGYDGVFGTVKIFTDRERNQLLGQQNLFSTFEKKMESTKTVGQSSKTYLSKRTDVQKIEQQDKPVNPVVQLNDDQQSAVNHSDGPLMIVAGPGTGKTRTLTHKIARMIRSGADTERLLAVTFTNRAASEMKERLISLLKTTKLLPFVGTFHALGYRILSESMEDGALGVIDEQTRNALVRDSLELSGIDKRESGVSVKQLTGWIVAAKQRMLSSNDLLEDICPQEYMGCLIQCYETYQRLLRINNLVDFEDLIFRPIQLFEKDAHTRDKYADRFSDLFIDEYQDINIGQYRLIQLLAGKHANICIIGDPDQSIYGFRGSDAECFNWFKNDNEKARTIFLRRNYRSIQTILDVSAQVIQYNTDIPETGHRKKVYSNMSGDRTINIMEAVTEKAEAVAIGKSIEKMVGGTGFFSMDSGVVDASSVQESMSFSDFAVLYRTRNQGVIISQTLEKAGIPCQLVDRRNVLDHPGIQAVMAGFKISHGMGTFIDIQTAAYVFKPSLSTKTLDIFKTWGYRNNLSLKEALVQARRLPIPDMGRSRQQQLYKYTGSLFEFIKHVDGLSVADAIDRLSKTGGLWQQYLDDPLFKVGYRHIVAIAKENQSEPSRFMAAVSLSSNTDIYDQRVEKVTLMTMHAAKGLEFPVVFISGCEDESIPYRSADRPSDPEEERRLFYVALTRAQKHLLLTRANRRRVNGQMKVRQLSPFVKEIEKKYKRFSGQALEKAEKPSQEQLPLF